MIQLRTYQSEAIAALYSWFETHETGNPLIVLPTGAGKSLVAAKICQDALQWPNQRILILTHVRELIEQNHQALHRLWPESPSGIYCAGLKRKQAHNPITFASIQSVHKKAELIGWRDLIIIDECHLVGDTDGTMYRSFLEEMKKYNPHIRIIGLSATPYRLKSGYLHKGEDAIFTDIAFELPILRLVNEGYLSPLIGKSAVTHVETKDMAIIAGDFSSKEMEERFDEPALVAAAIKEIMEFGQDRKSWLIFCVSVKHAKNVAAVLNERGINAEAVSQETPPSERDRILADFKAGRLRCVTNVSVLTTGFDAPGIDLLAILRSTMSPGLFVQIAGRGMRLAPAKSNCLVLDFGENLLRHGPITHIKPPREGRRKKDEEEGIICPSCRIVAPIEDERCECGEILKPKACPSCKEISVSSAKECLACGHIFSTPREVNHRMKASYAEVMSNAPSITEVPNWFDVIDTTFEIHNKIGSPDSLRVTYRLKTVTVQEWIGFAHPKEYPRKLAAKWWLMRGGLSPVPATTEDAISRLEEIDGMRAAKILVRKEDGWNRIMQPELVKNDIPLSYADGNLGTYYIQHSKPQEFVSVKSTYQDDEIPF